MIYLLSFLFRLSLFIVCFILNRIKISPPITVSLILILFIGLSLLTYSMCSGYEYIACIPYSRPIPSISSYLNVSYFNNRIAFCSIKLCKSAIFCNNSTTYSTSILKIKIRNLLCLFYTIRSLM